jgi:hypothetical protein
MLRGHVAAWADAPSSPVPGEVDRVLGPALTREVDGVQKP